MDRPRLPPGRREGLGASVSPVDLHTRRSLSALVGEVGGLPDVSPVDPNPSEPACSGGGLVGSPSCRRTPPRGEETCVSRIAFVSPRTALRSSRLALCTHSCSSRLALWVCIAPPHAAMKMFIGGEFVCATASAICLEYAHEISPGTIAHFDVQELRDSLVEVCTELSRQRCKFAFLDKEHRDYLAANVPRPQTSTCSQTDPPPPSLPIASKTVRTAPSSVANAPSARGRPPRARVRGCGTDLAPRMCMAYAQGECMHGKRCFHMHGDTDAERQRATRRRAVVAKGLADARAALGPARQSTCAGPSPPAKPPERVWRSNTPKTSPRSPARPLRGPDGTPMPCRARAGWGDSDSESEPPSC